MRNETKDRIASRFLELPILHMLVRSLLYSVWFRLFFLAFLSLPVVLPLALTKIWRTTPAGFQPIVRISGIDWMQARSLRRTAVQELQNGKVRDGIISYGAALANNPADLKLVRGFLRQIIEHVDPPEFQGPALSRAFWLLRLTQTNLVELELAATVFEKYGIDHYLISLLKPQQSKLTPPLQKHYLLALFKDGQLGEFDRFWSSPTRSPALLDDPEVRLYRAAFAAGWSPSSASELGGVRLEEYFVDPQWRVLANRLYLHVCEQRNEVDHYMSALARLQEWGKARVTDHVRGWRLLAANGRKDEAIQLAREFSDLPSTAIETAQLAQALFQLNLREAAEKLLDRFVLEFSFLDGLWVLYGDLLIESGRWDKLRQFALSMRLNTEVRERLSDYSYYLEGRVELAKSAFLAAEAAFGKIGTQSYANPELGLAIAQGLQRLGYGRAARPLLAGLEPQSETNPGYWEAVTATAFEAKDPELLLRAATKALSLNPMNWKLMNNFAAASLINRTNAEESIKYTFQLIQHFPNNLAMRINHGLALAQNHRYAEADALLAAISPQSLTESERTLYYLACIETLVHQKRIELARSFLREIDVAQLFPAQKEALDRLITRE
jgi:hypothetical protein